MRRKVFIWILIASTFLLAASCTQVNAGTDPLTTDNTYDQSSQATPTSLSSDTAKDTPLIPTAPGSEATPQQTVATQPKTSPISPQIVTPSPKPNSTTANPTNSVAKPVKIADILNAPNSFLGQAVIVEGKIVAECGSGCWFTLKDSTGTIYVDLAPANLVIPQKRGASARVTGTVVQKSGDTYINGTKVDF